MEARREENARDWLAFDFGPAPSVSLGFELCESIDKRRQGLVSFFKIFDTPVPHSLHFPRTMQQPFFSTWVVPSTTATFRLHFTQ